MIVVYILSISINLRAVGLIAIFYFKLKKILFLKYSSVKTSFRSMPEFEQLVFEFQGFIADLAHPRDTSKIQTFARDSQVSYLYTVAVYVKIYLEE